MLRSLLALFALAWMTVAGNAITFAVNPGETWRVDYGMGTMTWESCDIFGCGFTSHIFGARMAAPYPGGQPGFTTPVDYGTRNNCEWDWGFGATGPGVACEFIGDTQGNGDLYIVYSILSGFNKSFNVTAIGIMYGDCHTPGCQTTATLISSVPIPGTLPSLSIVLLTLGLARRFKLV
jgi:hypothetical protein